MVIPAVHNPTLSVSSKVGSSLDTTRSCAGLTGNWTVPQSTATKVGNISLTLDFFTFPLFGNLIQGITDTAEQEFSNEGVFARDKLGTAGPTHIVSVGLADLLDAVDAQHDDAAVTVFIVDGLERNLVHGPCLDEDPRGFLPTQFVKESARTADDHRAQRFTFCDHQGHLTVPAGEHDGGLLDVLNLLHATQHSAVAQIVLGHHAHEFAAQSLQAAASERSENSEYFHVDPRCRLSRAGFFLTRSSLPQTQPRSANGNFRAATKEVCDASDSP